MSIFIRISLALKKYFTPYKFCLEGNDHNFQGERYGNRYGLGLSAVCTVCGMSLERYSCPSFESETWADKNGKVLFDDTLHLSD